MAGILCLGMLSSLTMTAQAEEWMAALSYDVIVNGAVQEDLFLGGYTNGYDNRIYLSLRDLAAALNGTENQFDFAYDTYDGCYDITTGREYAAYTNAEPPTLEEEPMTIEGDYIDEEGRLRNAEDEIIQEPGWNMAIRSDVEYLDLYLNPLRVDGREVRYYTYQLSLMRDLYVNVIDAELLLGITISREDDHTLRIQTGGFLVDLSAFTEDGYFDLYNGVLLGDATTGEILYGCKENTMDAIASTSKLMTYLIVARYMELGKIHMDDVVTLSQNVENLAYSGYGTMYMDAGQEVTVRDLLGAMLLVSSNESALALAEYVAGSEQEFLRMTAEMSRILDMDTAKFYNANGLPVYSDSLIASKTQNRMSAADLFRLSCAVLRKYPEVTEFTSQQSMYLPSFDYTVNNTNYLLWNMEQAIGLKTGTTDEAGCCLVAAVKTTAADGEHTLVAIILGAENNIDRYQVPAVLLHWGINQLEE